MADTHDPTGKIYWHACGTSVGMPALREERAKQQEAWARAQEQSAATYTADLCPAEGFRDVGGAREIDLARRAAEEALDEYARLAFGWNAPDDEHTRHSLRGLAENAIRDNDPASSTTEPCPTCDGAGCPECSDRFGPRWPDDEMCPNCVTPWKCNGPHKPASSSAPTEGGET